jgi:Dihydrodipicolinate synthase/N-acetylneuraminate lyase
MTSNTSALEGIVAIPITPFTDGRIDDDAYRTILDRILDAGVTTLTPNGNTGEFYALTAAERRHVLEVCAAHTASRAILVAGVGFDVATAIADARHAAEHGAEFIMIHQPVHPYISKQGWIDYHAAIAGAVPDLNVVLYVKTPRVDGTMIRELVDRSPNVVGVKYALPDPVLFAAVRAHAPEIVWIAGLAEPYALSYFAHGATGFTSGLVNVVPALSQKLLEALRAGDFAEARELEARIAEFERLRGADSSADNVSVVKEALAQLGVVSREIRPPSAPVSEHAAERVSAILTDWARDFEGLAR